LKQNGFSASVFWQHWQTSVGLHNLTPSISHLRILARAL
jgi:hypothetical protein